MKTKEQILKWLDKQPWKGEFYEETFINRLGQTFYDEHFICGAFDWSATKSGAGIWKQRDIDFRQWFDSNDRPMSWAQYCAENPIKDEYYIDKFAKLQEVKQGMRGINEDINVMSKGLCEAFLAYMKLIQLRNAWVEDGDENLCRIVWSPNKGFWWVRCAHNGLSFPTPEMADEFIKTFKDLLEIAKPLI